jgi:hypothetical protein
MTRSRTRSIRTASLSSDEVLAPVLVRIMMSVNDIAMVNGALFDWDAAEERRKQGRKGGGKLYYSRMQMGHIYEALSIIDEIGKTASLLDLVEKCDDKTICSFRQLQAFVNSTDFAILRRVRNNAAFHYDGKLALRNLRDIVNKSPRHQSLYTLGMEPLDWYFEIADLILDRLVVTDICNIPDGPNRIAQSDVIMERFEIMANAFTDFAANFISNYV